MPSVTSWPKVGGVLDFNALKYGDTWAALITFLYLDFLDATSTMYAMARLVDQQVCGISWHSCRMSIALAGPGL